MVVTLASYHRQVIWAASATDQDKWNTHLSSKPWPKRPLFLLFGLHLAPILCELLSKLVLDEREGSAVARNRSGELFLEAIELQLHLFDDAIDQALRRKIKEEGTGAGSAEGMPNAGLSHLLRAVRGAVRRVDAGHEHLNDQALKGAAADFAGTVMPDATITRGFLPGFPGKRAGNPSLCFVLHHMGFFVRSRLREDPVGSCPAFSPLPNTTSCQWSVSVVS